MLKSLSLSNFKCFKEKSVFELGKVTIFSGYNGRGKSSVLQSLLLLSQSALKDGKIDKLHIEGDWVKQGSYEDLIHASAENWDIEIGITSDDKTCENVELTYSPINDSLVGKLTKCFVNNEDYFGVVGFAGGADAEAKSLVRELPRNFISQLCGIHYISANRRGPIRFVEQKEVPEIQKVGKNGEDTINTLASCNSTFVEMNLNVDDKNEHSLANQVSSWMSFIMEENAGKVIVPDNDKDGKSNILSILYSDGKYCYIPDNVGFGYSYILGIIVTALIAKPGTIVIVENPEAHLHPSAQSRITQLLAKLADRGVQVFVETHSEHIMNGFRLTALRESFKLSNEDLSLYFFDKDLPAKHLNIEKNGRIKNWPIGFFDQAESDLAEIIRLGSKIQ